MRRVVKNPHAVSWGAVVMSLATAVGGFTAYLQSQEETKKHHEKRYEMDINEAIHEAREQWDTEQWRKLLEERVEALEKRVFRNNRGYGSGEAGASAPTEKEEPPPLWKLKKQAEQKVEKIRKGL